MKRLTAKILVVIILALVIYLGLALFSATLHAPSDERGTENREFKGPMGDPYVKGPTSSPPGF